MHNGEIVPSPPPLEPPSSASLWGDMFGLGNFFKIVSDPQLGAQAIAMMRAIAESAAAQHRIERKLDAVLADIAKAGHDSGGVHAGSSAPLLAADGGNGIGGLAAPRNIIDGRAGGAAQ